MCGAIELACIRDYKERYVWAERLAKLLSYVNVRDKFIKGLDKRVCVEKEE